MSGELISYNFVDSATEMPIAHVTFKFEKKSIASEKTYMVIESIYCTIPSLLLDFISYFMHLVIKKKVDGVVYRSKNSKTPLNKFLKSIGFKILDKKDGKYMNILSLSDVLYNQTFFNLACCYKNRIIS
ncbi:hypothetical protein [Vibrio algarum]|uniref:Uncharacterized protein n=1 Tax=Vibrio algarum TaxID=3020714 RepID=A0ABT4YX30_9VIBR|nr:hypothetical protein [Vibrio sp. KJ40-1]MDB1126144.1 hypothetical protein [Vibrio sp. KJ40-1]